MTLVYARKDVDGFWWQAFNPHSRRLFLFWYILFVNCICVISLCTGKKDNESFEFSPGLSFFLSVYLACPLHKICFYWDKYIVNKWQWLLPWYTVHTYQSIYNDFLQIPISIKAISHIALNPSRRCLTCGAKWTFF